MGGRWDLIGRCKTLGGLFLFWLGMPLVAVFMLPSQTAPSAHQGQGVGAQLADQRALLLPQHRHLAACSRQGG